MSWWVVRHEHSERESLLSVSSVGAHLVFTPANQHALIQLHKLSLHEITDQLMKPRLVKQESAVLSVMEMEKTSTIHHFVQLHQHINSLLLQAYWCTFFVIHVVNKNIMLLNVSIATVNKPFHLYLSRR